MAPRSEFRLHLTCRSPVTLSCLTLYPRQAGQHREGKARQCKQERQGSAVSKEGQGSEISSGKGGSADRESNAVKGNLVVRGKTVQTENVTEFEREPVEIGGSVAFLLRGFSSCGAVRERFPWVSP